MEQILVLLLLILITVLVVVLEPKVKNYLKKIRGVSDSEILSLDDLATEVQVNYFKNLFGDPTFVNYSENNQTKEYIFIEDSFYVQLITDNNDKVLSYAVTLRDKEKSIYISSIESFFLGKTTIEEIYPDDKPNKCYFFLSGATAPSFYFEQYYFGNPGLYQTYIIGYNPVGHTGSDLSLLATDSVQYKDEEYSVDCENINSEGRNKLQPNTYMVISPYAEFEDLEIDFKKRYIGPNELQLSLLFTGQRVNEVEYPESLKLIEK